MVIVEAVQDTNMTAQALFGQVSVEINDVGFGHSHCPYNDLGEIYSDQQAKKRPRF
jgi:carbamate kinase